MFLLNKAVIILLIVIFLLFLVFLWPSAIGGDTGFIIVYGQSMLPTIQPGSMVIIKKQPTYQIDDIVSYTHREGPLSKNIVHRIIDQTNQGFVIKGDSNPEKDEGFQTIENINGKVIFATPYIGDILLLFRNPIFMFISSVVVFVIDSEQKRRKTKKEKIRRIQLGLPPEIKKAKENNKTKPKKADYRLFIVAIIFNILTYVVMQVSLSYRLSPEGDMITGFLFKILEPYNASTISFGLYFLFIVGLYFSAKVYEAKLLKKISTTSKKSKSIGLLVGKDFNPVLLVTQFLLVVFIIMSLFHLFTIGGDLIEVVT